ncbi:hypothetical protein DQ237_10165 [Blastococcus sp. TF02-8]|uniref:putative T7SS-secreted protein n=1 Tax=Blastococcus sp. TF02-8 TaxID=2250574 RepID=UPI000DEBAAD1|nr:hypothetical protein [Blastococcus sp. TF02-8]RBY96221.1 hypothetical protein DQ237_10165 [Blastococcus sp. TF02-8]
MSARSGDWSLLGHDRDPVPGSPEEVERLANGYASTARDIERLAGQLRRLSNLEGWTGEAAEVFAEAAEDLSDDLRGAERRYEELADAVRAWVGPLTTARDESAGALSQAEQADEKRRQNATDGLAGVADPTPEQLAADDLRQQNLADAGDESDAARQRLANALEELESAANRTADKIRRAGEHGADRWWNDFGGFVREISDVLKVIAIVLEVIAIVLIVVAMVFTGPFALVAGAVVSTLLLGIHTAMVLSDVEGATWTDVIMDVISLVTLGIGGRLGAVVKNGLARLRPQVAQHADDAARTTQEALEHAQPNFSRASNAQNIANPSNPLRAWGDQYLDDAAERASSAGAAEAQRVMTDVVTDAPWPLRARTLDRELAENLLEAQRLGAEPIPAALTSRLDRLTGLMQVTQGINRGSAVTDVADFGLERAGVDWKESVDDTASRMMWRLTSQ